MNLEAEARKPWAERDKWLIAREWPTYQKYHGLPDLPEGAVYAGEYHEDGTPAVIDGWYWFPHNSYWKAGTHIGGIPTGHYCCPLDYLLPDAPPEGEWGEWEWDWGAANEEWPWAFNTSFPELGWVEGRSTFGVRHVLYARRKKPARVDPPESEWPAPPEGHQAVARGYGWEPGRKCRYCLWHKPSRKWYYDALWQENLPEGEEESFYLEAVPLDPAPFDGPEDFQTARCRWPILKSGDVIICPSEITNNGVRIDGVLRSWKSLKDFGFQYSGGINGPWEKFEKGSASE